MEQAPIWPTDKNGNNLRFGDMTKEQRREQTEWALRRIKTELEHPKFVAALAQNEK